MAVAAMMLVSSICIVRDLHVACCEGGFVRRKRTARRYSCSVMRSEAAACWRLSLASSSICHDALRDPLFERHLRKVRLPLRVRHAERPLLARFRAVARETTGHGGLDAAVAAAAPDGARSRGDGCQVHWGFRVGY